MSFGFRAKGSRQGVKILRVDAKRLPSSLWKHYRPLYAEYLLRFPYGCGVPSSFLVSHWPMANLMGFVSTTVSHTRTAAVMRTCRLGPGKLLPNLLYALAATARILKATETTCFCERFYARTPFTPYGNRSIRCSGFQYPCFLSPPYGRFSSVAQLAKTRGESSLCDLFLG